MLGCACRRESNHTSTTFGTDTDKGMAGTLKLCFDPHSIQCARDKNAPFYYTDHTWTEKHGGFWSSTVNWTTNTSPLSRDFKKWSDYAIKTGQAKLGDLTCTDGSAMHKVAAFKSQRGMWPPSFRFLVEHNRVKKITKTHHAYVKTEGGRRREWRYCPTSQLFKIHSKGIWWHRQWELSF